MHGLTFAQIFAIVTLVTTIVSIGTGHWIPSDVDTCLENVGIKLETECAGQGDIIKYHCLPFDLSYDFGTICIEWKWIAPGNCPYFNSNYGEIDERECQSEFECPKVKYKSYESYKYEACYIQFNSTTNLSPTSIKSNDLTIAVTTQKQNVTEEDNKSTDNAVEDIDTIISVIAIFSAAAIISVTSIILTIVICRCNRMRQSGLFDVQTENISIVGITETSNLLHGSTEEENARNENGFPKIDVAQVNEELNKGTRVEKLTETDKQIKLHLAALMGSVISRLLCTMIDNLTDDSFEKIVQRKDVKEYLTEKFKSEPYILANLYISDDEDDNDEEMADESINRADVPVEVLLSILEDMIPELKTEDKNEIKTLKEGRDYLANIDDKKPMKEFEKNWEKTKACIEHIDRKYGSGIYDELRESERKVRESLSTKRDDDQDSDVDDLDLSVTTAKEMKLQKFMKLAQIIGDAIFRLMCTIVEEEPGSQLKDILHREDIKEFLQGRIESHEYTLLYGEDDKPAMENLTFNIVFYIGVECLNLPVETVTEIKRLKTGRTYFDSLKGTEDEEEIKEKWIELAKSVKVLDDRYETGVYKDLCEHAKQYMPKLE